VDTEIKFRIHKATVAINRKKTLFFSKFCKVLKMRHFRKETRNAWKVLKCSAEEG
jgi:hypothetical protein